MAHIVNTAQDKWLVDADSANALAPDGYDDDAELAHVRSLHERLTLSLPTYVVKTLSPAAYQDGTGLAESRVSRKGADPRQRIETLALVLLSHFGRLSTIAECDDPELLTTIRQELEKLQFKYIEFDYLVGKTYEGKCKAFVGLDCLNRYFSIAPKFNDE